MKKIRQARPEDATPIAAIYGPYVMNTSVSFETEVPTVDELKNRIIETSLKFPWLVYEIDGVVAGYAYAGPHRSRCAYGWSVESTVYLHPEFQGRGIGSSLYRVLFELLKAQGFVNVFAGIALPNDSSVRLHKKLGFNSIGVFKDIGFKLNRWWDVSWWQLSLQKPNLPSAPSKPVSQFEKIV